MAKSINFFGLRRGSTKSQTYQVYRGVQITKDRVTSVSNPQSNGQMEQRLKLPIVSQARSLLKDLVDHSWEGVTYGDKSLTKFATENLTKGQLNIYQYTPKGIMDCGVSDLKISDGSLTNIYNKPTTLDVVDGGTGYNFVVGNGITSGDTTSPAMTAHNVGSDVDDNIIAAIKYALNLESNDQLTFLFQRKTDTYTFSSNGAEGKGSYHRFTISRLIMDKDKATQWKVNEAIAESAAGAELSIVLTDGYLTVAISTQGIANGGSSLQVKYANDNYLTDFVAGAVIFSRQVDNVWRRSPARLNVIQSIKDGGTDTDYDNVVNTYLKSTSTSAKYLNTGTEGVSITGGN